MNWFRKATKDMKKFNQLYVDLDGVLAWWNKATVEQCEDVEWEDLPILKGDPKRDILQNFMDDNYDFWVSIPRIPHFDQIWDLIKHHDPMVLTSPHDVKDMDCKRGKEDWCKRELGLDVDRVIVEKKKYKYATTDGKPNILIDDMDYNIEAWQKHGGIPIEVARDSSNIDEVVAKLEKYLT